jgi:protein gp37
MKEIRIVNQRRIPAYYWDPWVGCEKVSAGCLNCFIIEPEFRFQGIYQQCFDDEKAYGNLVLTTLHSDFFIDKADEYRNAAWEFIKNKPNSLFLIVTKRVERIKDCLPADWNDGYDNVIISVTTETQEMIERRIPIFREVRAKHKWLSVSPLIEQVDLSKYLAEG